MTLRPTAILAVRRADCDKLDVPAAERARQDGPVDCPGPETAEQCGEAPCAPTQKPRTKLIYIGKR